MIGVCARKRKAARQNPNTRACLQAQQTVVRVLTSGGGTSIATCYWKPYQESCMRFTYHPMHIQKEGSFSFFIETFYLYSGFNTFQVGCNPSYKSPSSNSNEYWINIGQVFEDFHPVWITEKVAVRFSKVITKTLTGRGNNFFVFWLSDFWDLFFSFTYNLSYRFWVC